MSLRASAALRESRIVAIPFSSGTGFRPRKIHSNSSGALFVSQSLFHQGQVSDVELLADDNGMPIWFVAIPFSSGTGFRRRVRARRVLGGREIRRNPFFIRDRFQTLAQASDAEKVLIGAASQSLFHQGQVSDERREGSSPSSARLSRRNPFFIRDRFQTESIGGETDSGPL